MQIMICNGKVNILSLSKPSAEVRYLILRDDLHIKHD